jgi:hypothetical protein
MSVELPKDAEGREIPLDVDALYKENGKRVEVYRWNFVRGNRYKWTFGLLFDYPNCPLYPQDYYLTPPDSWEKLEEDLDRGADALNYEACAYFGKSTRACSSCIADKGKTCESVAMRDILARIRKLRGEDA